MSDDWGGPSEYMGFRHRSYIRRFWLLRLLRNTFDPMKPADIPKRADRHQKEGGGLGRPLHAAEKENQHSAEEQPNPGNDDNKGLR